MDITTLPAVLAGPVLRRVTRSRMSVWVGLSLGSNVTVHVRVAGQPATEVTGTPATPIKVGLHLWLALVEAGPPGGTTFAAGSLYEYRLSSPGWPAEPNWADLAIGTAQPAFPGPPTAIDDLVVLHASCRKPHGGGRDALATATDLVEERVNAGVPNSRPHLMVLSGDQIYADEVPGPMAPRVRRIADDLVGIDETGVFGPLPPINGRQQPSESFGLTSEAAANHLWTLGEYLASYLLYWSDSLWPAALPVWADVTPATDLPAGLTAEQLAAAEVTWNDQHAAVERFHAGLPAVRRLLATVPTLMVPDDHEVTDDWNLDHAWATAVYANPAGSRVVFNGVLAYALCQHWGNIPSRFATPDTPEGAVLAAAIHTGASPDSAATRGLLGVPTGPPSAPPTELRDPLDPGAVRYNTQLGPADGWPVRVIGLDERTVREFLRADRPAARISLTALASALPGPATGEPPASATLVVAPSPVLGTHVVEHLLQPAVGLLPGGTTYADFESWPAATAQHQELLRRLAAYAPVVLLGGDVHYAATTALAYTSGGATTRGAGVTSSATKNADAKTMILHLFGDFAMRVGLERPRRFVGFSSLDPVQRASLASPPAAGTVLPWDDLVDVLLGRVFRSGQQSPAILSQEVATAYGFGSGEWHYDVEPVDDERMPGPGELLTHMAGAPAPWVGWDPVNSVAMVLALRASDLHRIGRVWDGLPQTSMLTFSGSLVLAHTLTSPVGEDLANPARHTTLTTVGLA